MQAVVCGHGPTVLGEHGGACVTPDFTYVHPPRGGGYSIHRAKRRAYALVALLYRDRFLLQLQLHKRIKFVLLVALVQRHVSAKSEFYMTFSATRKSEARNGSTGRTDTQTDRRTDGHVQGLMRPAGGCIITYC